MDAADLSRILRNQAWERAKGELRAMLTTFYGEVNSREGQFDELDAAVDTFVEKVEKEGLQE